MDCHFAVSFKSLKRYITEPKFDVLTPEDKVDTLRYDGGVKNTFVDYIRVNRDFQKIVKLECAEKVKLIYNLESPAEIMYDRKEDVTYLIKFYRYSGMHYRVTKVSEFEITQVVNSANHVIADKETYPRLQERLTEKENWRWRKPQEKRRNER